VSAAVTMASWTRRSRSMRRGYTGFLLSGLSARAWIGLPALSAACLGPAVDKHDADPHAENEGQPAARAEAYKEKVRRYLKESVAEEEDSRTQTVMCEKPKATASRSRCQLAARIPALPRLRSMVVAGGLSADIRASLPGEGSLHALSGPGVTSIAGAGILRPKQAPRSIHCSTIHPSR
jgi:hypothetical protein